MRHGTRSGYVLGCRCEWCRKANATYQRNYMAARRQRATTKNHGTQSGYYCDGCRCDECRAEASRLRAEAKEAMES